MESMVLNLPVFNMAMGLRFGEQDASTKNWSHVSQKFKRDSSKIHYPSKFRIIFVVHPTGDEAIPDRLPDCIFLRHLRLNAGKRVSSKTK